MLIGSGVLISMNFYDKGSNKSALGAKVTSEEIASEKGGKNMEKNTNPMLCSWPVVFTVKG